MQFRFVFTFVTLILFLFSCNQQQKRVRVIGEKMIVTISKDGKEVVDTVSAVVPSFSFQNHKLTYTSNQGMKGKVVLADFFFTHCPSICVQMKQNMLKVNEQFKNDKNFSIVSFTIDPKRDTVARLADYARQLGVENTNWYFLTGEKDSIYNVAKQFLAYAEEDEKSPGGYIHDGNFILIDKRGRIRGFYNGVDEKVMPTLIEDIKSLINE